jgi:ATP-dependent helicase HrpA
MSDLPSLQARVSELMLRDQRRLQRRLDPLRRGRGNPETRQATLDQLEADIAAAESRVAQRRAGVPVIRYPQELPVSQKKDDIAAAIRGHQVVIVAGETGSGKTTQLPSSAGASPG